MPQGRRKVPFSTKQKKVQLQQRRERKNSGSHAPHELESEIVPGQSSSTVSCLDPDVEVINKQPTSSSKCNPNKYRLVFKRDKDSDIKQRLALSRDPFDPLSEEKLEVSYEQVFVPSSELDMPKRPPWDYCLTKEQLESREEKYFREYIDNLESRFKDDLSHFEMNLETWRQLWRVVEFSDIVLLVTDARYPVFHFSPALYHYVTKELKKDMILVLNKIDLVPAAAVVAWKEYFKNHFPELHIMCYASYAGMILKEGKRGRRIGKLHMAIEGSRDLLQLCEEIVRDEVDLFSWHLKIEAEATEIGGNKEADVYSECEADDEDEDFRALKKSKILGVANDTSQYREARYRDGCLTIGFVGHPNVGKSSFLNAVLGKKVVSVSRTPGHTKHYQTIVLTPTVRLCDCPGLVFPSLVPKPMQVLMGCYPISQLREPYSVIAFLCQRVPVHSILKIQHPEFELKDPDRELRWSPYDICEAWAMKRGFVTARSARPDVFRAANNILRMALDGRTICLTFYPPNFTNDKDMWYHHPEVENVKAIQAFRQKERTEKTYFVAKKLAAELSASSDNYNQNDSSNSSSDTDMDDNDDEDSPRSNTFANKFDVLANLS